MDLWNDTPPQLRFGGVCIVTGDVRRLRAFYESVFGIEGEGDDEHVDLRPAGAGLAIFSAAGMERMAPGSMAGTGAGNVVLGIHLDGGAEVIDALHTRLLALEIPIVKPPQTHPWGARSVWCRDPDGNVVTFAARVEE